MGIDDSNLYPLRELPALCSDFMAVSRNPSLAPILMWEYRLAISKAFFRCSLRARMGFPKKLVASQANMARTADADRVIMRLHTCCLRIIYYGKWLIVAGKLRHNPGIGAGQGRKSQVRGDWSKRPARGRSGGSEYLRKGLITQLYPARNHPPPSARTTRDRSGGRSRGPSSSLAPPRG